MTKTRIGIIGCGKQAPKHIGGLKKVVGVEMVLADIESGLAQELAEKEGVSWVSDPDEILADKDIEAICICTPTTSHFQFITQALKEGKDVFCEKPLCESLEEAVHLKELAAQTGRVVMVGYIYRFSPVFELGFELFRRQWVDSASLVLGRPLWGLFRLGGRGSHQLWKHQKANGGGAINEMLVHMIDLAGWYLGPFEKVEVISCRLNCPQRVINGEKVQVDAEDFVLIKCTNSSGIDIFCQADLLTPAFSQYVDIQCENGSFVGSIQAEVPSYIFLKEARAGYGVGRTDLNFGQRNLFDAQMDAFVQVVRRGKTLVRNTVEDSIQLIRISTDIRNQMEG